MLHLCLFTRVHRLPLCAAKMHRVHCATSRVPDTSGAAHQVGCSAKGRDCLAGLGQGPTHRHIRPLLLFHLHHLPANRESTGSVASRIHTSTEHCEGGRFSQQSTSSPWAMHVKTHLDAHGVKPALQAALEHSKRQCRLGHEARLLEEHSAAAIHWHRIQE
jgi:hypothetical protein